MSPFHLDGGAIESEVNNKLIFMLIKDNRPLSTVDKVGFRKFVQSLCSLYTPPSRKTVTRLISNKYEFLSNVIKEELGNAESVALTADIWTDTSTRSYLGATAHYCVNFTKKNIMIGVSELDVNHTSVNLANSLNNIIDEWKIKKDKIVCFVTDNASNIKSAVNNIFKDTEHPNRHLGCYAHSLNLVVTNILKKNEEVSSICNNIRKIVTTFRRSVPLSDQLRKRTDLKLVQDVETRWNSTYDMLERFLELWDHIVAVLLDNDGTTMLSLILSELDLCKELVKLLKPFKKATNMLSGKLYTTGSQVIPVLRILRQKIDSCSSNDSLILDMKRDLLREFKGRFEYVESEPLLAMATVLDPRYKKVPSTSKILCSRAINKITDILNKNKKEICGHEERNLAFHCQSMDRNSSFWDDYDELVQQYKQNICTDISDDEMPREFRLYLDDPPIDRSECPCPLKYWKSHPFSPLRKLAERYLTVIATSVPCESLFSRAGIIMTDLRNRLTPRHLQNILFLNSLPEEDWNL